MHTLKPLDIECVCLQPAARDLCLLSKSIIGGLRSAVAEVLAESDTSHVLFQRIGIPPVFSPHIETQDYMQRQHGLEPGLYCRIGAQTVANQRHVARAIGNRALKS